MFPVRNQCYLSSSHGYVLKFILFLDMLKSSLVDSCGVNYENGNILLRMKYFGGGSKKFIQKHKHIIFYACACMQLCFSMQWNIYRSWQSVVLWSIAVVPYGWHTMVQVLAIYRRVKIITLFDLLLRYTVKWKIVPIIKLFTIQYLRRDLCMVCLWMLLISL